MAVARLPAVFARGGTSKAVLFKACDLPPERSIRDRIFLHVLGSPDPYGRQLDGLGGGLSSLSKVVIVDRSKREDTDVDCTFVQVAVDEAVADYGSMCGNMSASVGPFAVDEGLVRVADGQSRVRIYNTNTDKLLHATFRVEDGRAVEEGMFEIPGVPGTGAEIRLDYFSTQGAVTGKLLPTGTPTNRLRIAGGGEIEVSLVDASNPVVFVRAADLGYTATDSPEALETNGDLMSTLDAIRRAGAVAMGIADGPDAVPLSVPKVAMLDGPADFTALDGRPCKAEGHHIAIRMVSMGNIHRAVTLTGAMCLATAVGIPGTIPHALATGRGSIRVANPSGVLPVAAEVSADGEGNPVTAKATTFRTQRRIMEGCVRFPRCLLAP